jgi:hypothetical protein
LELLLGLCRFGSRKAKKGELRIRDKKYLLKELRIIANTGRSFLLQPLKINDYNLRCMKQKK